MSVFKERIISISVFWCLETRTRISFFQSHASRPGIHISAKEMFDTILYFHEPATIGQHTAGQQRAGQHIDKQHKAGLVFITVFNERLISVRVENISLSISCFETRTRISFFQSHPSRPGNYISAKEIFITLLYLNERVAIWQHTAGQQRAGQHIAGQHTAVFRYQPKKWSSHFYTFMSEMLNIADS